MGTGCLGLKVAEFFEMRPAHFFLMLFEYNREQESNYRWNAELVRMQTVELMNLHGKVLKTEIKAQQLWKFPWDDEGKVNAIEEMKKMSREELEEGLREFLKRKREGV